MNSLSPKTYDEALKRKRASDAHRKPRSPLGHGRKGMNRRGKKVQSWEVERAKLKRQFLAAGIITCELRYAGCAFDDYLGFAHAKKRRKLTIEDLSIVILACNFCHDQIETMPHGDMERIVMAVIAARAIQP